MSAVDIMHAIERVADKRHGRMCAVMPEAEAAANIIKYLEHMERKYKDSRHLLGFIRSLKEGYSA